MTIKTIPFKLDSLDWIGGVSDTFSEIPLGSLSKPLPIEEIADVEWTIVEDNFIFISQVDPDTQLKYWFKLSERARQKIQEISHEFFPFEKKDISDRYLLSYSVEGLNDKYIGFTFESVLKNSKKSIYVYMQANINNKEEEAKTFLQKYLEDIEHEDDEDDEEKEGLLSKIKSFFRRKK